MRSCEQTKGQSVYDHGVSVNQYLHDLIKFLSGKKKKYDWKLPDWLTENAQTVLANLHDYDIINEYAILHDIGKPFCLTVDADGRRHFPNHAEVSKQIYLECDGNQTVANLIGWDMCLHVSTSEEIDRMIMVWSKQDAATLILSSLSEIHSNAAMFGGIDSTSFKIKWKKWNKNARRIFNAIV